MIGEPYEWLTFQEVAETISKFIDAVRLLDLCREIEIKDSGIDQKMWRTMGFYSENRAEYVIAMLACISDSITVIPINAKPTDVSTA